MKSRKWWHGWHGWQTCLLALAVSACSTPFCNAPGGLCASGTANTSGAPAPALATAATPATAVTPLPVAPPEPEPEPSAAETFAVQLPPPSPRDAMAEPLPAPAPASAPVSNAAPLRIALLLPLQSATLGDAAAAVRDGVLAAWELEPDNISITAIDTGDVAQDVLYRYAQAVQSHDAVIGPLSRAAVTTLAASALVSKPTVVLNYPEGHGSADASPLPQLMLAMGLSLEDEARQLARRVAANLPVSIVSTATPWQQRVAAAFAAQWQADGHPAYRAELGTPDGELSDAEILQWYARLRTQRPGLLFSAMGAEQTRHLLAVLAEADAGEPVRLLTGLHIYGTSALNTGQPLPALNGVRLLDLPWRLQPDHAAVMSYPRPTPPAGADLERLYALGIDAYRVLRAISRAPDGAIRLDGVTGQLRIDFGHGPAQFERSEPAAEYRDGQPQVLTQ